VLLCLVSYMIMHTTASLKADLDREVAKSPPLADVIRGTLQRCYLTCGNSGCRCHRATRNRHGPYWYVAVSYAKGRQRRYLLPVSQVPRAKRGIAAYRRLWERLCRVSELNLALLKRKE
jgi:hypothetical protein